MPAPIRSFSQQSPAPLNQAFWHPNRNTVEYTLLYRSTQHPNRWYPLQYGWVKKENNQWIAQHPFVDEDDPDHDCHTLGSYDALEDAMEAVEKANPPRYGRWI